MIILDTNVISEIVEPKANANVVAWLDAQSGSELWITSITLAELEIGLHILPDGRRKEGLHSDLSTVLGRVFSSKILAFDEAAARLIGPLTASRQFAGRRIEFADAQIAAIARVHGATVATRNVADFEDTGVEIINPWDIDLT